MTCDQLAAAIAERPYCGWRCIQEGGLIRLQSPMRYPDGGLIEIFIESRADRFFVTDMGEAYRFLETHGIDPLRGATRGRMISVAVELGGAVTTSEEIAIAVDNPAEIMLAAVRLGQVVTRVSDLVLQASGVLGATFTETVGEYLAENARTIEIKRGGSVRGRATSHNVDFVIRSHRGIAALEALSAASPVGANAQTAFTIQKFADIAAIGPGAPARYTVLDDAADVWTEPLRLQLMNYSTVIDWEQRDRLLREITSDD